MRTWSRGSTLRTVLAMMGSGVLLLQAGCPVDIGGLIARQATQVFSDSLFFVLESALVRAI